MGICMSLQEAIKEQNLDEVVSILAQYPNCVEDKTEEGVPLCLYAAQTGNFPIVKYIVEYTRASMNAVDDDNRNILHYAAMAGNLEMNRYLVEKVGMSITAGDKELVTPYQIAWEKGHKELLAYYEKCVGAAYEDMYHNPIRTGMFPDPSVVRVGEDYYMVNSSFFFFPCIPISHSRDLINWDIIGYAITNPEWAKLDELEGGRGYWAPDISYDNGTFYITATYRMNDTGTVYRKQIVVSSDKPEGPYSEPAVIEEDGIDPSLFHEDGRHYMLLNRGARIFELSSDCKKKISDAVLIYYGDHKRAPEGPHLLKKDGYYYLFLAEGGTGPEHRITVARSKELMGNYEPCPYNPIMRQMDEKAALQRCGHGKPVCTQNGEWYMVYLCGRRLVDQYSILGRETALDPITWTKDGWPIVNNLDGPSVLQIKPNLPNMTKASGIVRSSNIAEGSNLTGASGVARSSNVAEDSNLTGASGMARTSNVAEDSNLTGASDMTDVSYKADEQGGQDKAAQTTLTEQVKAFVNGLPKDFVTPRPPEKGGIVIKDGRLVLKGSRYPLSSVDSRNILVRRQSAFCFRAEAEFIVPTLGEGQEAGITCYYDENTWVNFFFSKEGDSYFIQVKEHIGKVDLYHDKRFITDPEGEAYILGVETKYLQRRFYYGKVGSEIKNLEELSCVYYLCDEGVDIAKRFTGAMVGMYGYAKEEPLFIEYEDFRYREL